MKILLIAPFPPPVTGNSIAVENMRRHFESLHKVEYVNLSKGDFKSGSFNWSRFFEIFYVLFQIKKKKASCDLIYLTVSQSLLGNLKDILIYLVCYDSLPKMVIHLHGGAGMRIRFKNKRSLTTIVNKFFLQRLAGVIILGESHRDIYSFLPQEKIFIVPNFSEEYLFLSKLEIENKFINLRPLKVLFMSNLIEGKGYMELVNGFIKLPSSYKEQINIDFAGGFNSDLEELEFLKLIEPYPQLNYKNVVSGEVKREILKNAHVFILPTYYAFEGQPISILEAYASGCFVITTYHSGIPDIFRDSFNGIKVEGKSSDSISNALSYTIDNAKKLQEVGFRNWNIAKEKFTSSISNNSLKKIFDNICRYRN